MSQVFGDDRRPVLGTVGALWDPHCMEDVVLRAHEAMRARNWDDLRILLHPYLHWASSDGRTVRGRTKVMAMLAERDPPLWPMSVEVRDHQIYGWQEPPKRVTSSGRD